MRGNKGEDIAREMRKYESPPHRSMVEHVVQMQDRIVHVMPIVKEHLFKAQLAQQIIYNHGTILFHLVIECWYWSFWLKVNS